MYSVCKFVIFLLSLCHLICYSGSEAKVKAAQKSSKTVHFLSAEVTMNRTHMTHYTMKTRRDNKKIDIYVGVSHNYTIHPWIWLTVSLKNIRDKRNDPMFQYDFNSCSVLGKMGTHMKGFIKSWMKNFWSEGNMPQSCPILKGNYTWIGLTMESLNIPSFLPNTKYYVQVLTYFPVGDRKELVGNVHLLLELK